jgi:putative pyruvate formate lyase activating enzyme
LGARGVCGAAATLHVARAALHFWEEPPISGDAGSGAVFFSGCPLRCVFCQNHDISSGGFGLDVSVSRLAAIMLELKAQGALNINLVTPLHYAPQVRQAVLAARDAGLDLPIVCNTSGYELPDVIHAMADVVDVWLTDFKYADAALAARLSAAPDYPDVAAAALTAMCSCVDDAGGRTLDDDGRMLRGVIVRHLVLPGQADDSCAVLDRVWELTDGAVDLSVMNQYTPNDDCRAAHGDLARAVTDAEYERVLTYAEDLGFEHVWWQQGGTVSESFVPEFDATGVAGPDLGAR